MAISCFVETQNRASRAKKSTKHQRTQVLPLLKQVEGDRASKQQVRSFARAVLLIIIVAPLGTPSTSPTNHHLALYPGSYLSMSARVSLCRLAGWLCGCPCVRVGKELAPFVDRVAAACPHPVFFVWPFRNGSQWWCCGWCSGQRRWHQVRGRFGDAGGRGAVVLPRGTTRHVARQPLEAGIYVSRPVLYWLRARAHAAIHQDFFGRHERERGAVSRRFFCGGVFRVTSRRQRLPVAFGVEGVCVCVCVCLSGRPSFLFGCCFCLRTT